MDDQLTLQQGLERFHKKNEKYFGKIEYSEKGKEFLACHDITHVVFVCDTTIYGEGIVKLWTTFGTTLGFWKVITGYKEANAFKLASKFSFGHVIKNIFRLLIAVPKAIIRAKNMTKPWPFSDYEGYLNTPISEIRKEFNIKVL